MKFGLCMKHHNAHAASTLGADYAELNCSAIYDLDDAEFQLLKEKVRRKEISTYSCSILVKSNIRLTGDVNFGTVRDYAEKAFERMAELGITMLVFGSGQAKQVPEGFSFEKAWDQLYEVGAIFAETAEQNGQMIAVEAIRPAEVNIVNTLEDAAKYVKTVDHPHFKMLADFYHINENGEPLTEIAKYADLLVHTHIASPTRELITEEHRDFIAERIAALRAIGYSGGVSFEGKLSGTDDEIREMFRILRSC